MRSVLNQVDEKLWRNADELIKSKLSREVQDLAWQESFEADWDNTVRVAYTKAVRATFPSYTELP